MRQQTAIEFMTTYSFMFIVLAIGIMLMAFIASLPSLSLPQQCNSFSGPACTYVSYFSNKNLGYSLLTLILVNSETVPINVTSMNLTVKSTKVQGSCTPSFLYPGQSTVCAVNLRTTVPIGTLIEGFYSIGAQFCNSGISALQAANCNWEKVSYSGSVTAYASKERSIIFAVAAAVGPTTSNLLPFNAIRDLSQQMPNNYTIVQNGYWIANTTSNSLGYAFVNGAYVGNTYLGYVAHSFPASLSSLGNSNIACAAPYNSILSMASTTMYLSTSANSVGINATTAGAIEVFFKPAAPGNGWQNAFGGIAWKRQHATQYGPYVYRFNSGLYNLVIFWTDTCGSGAQAINLTGLPK